MEIPDTLDRAEALRPALRPRQSDSRTSVPASSLPSSGKVDRGMGLATVLLILLIYGECDWTREPAPNRPHAGYGQTDPLC